MTNEGPPPISGRGTGDNPPNRFERLSYAVDEEAGVDPEAPSPRTEFFRDASRTIITQNESPDVGFEASLNPYRGCEHGCIYCLSGDTSVLRGDGTATPLEDLRVGDEIYGTARRGWYRRYVKTRVLAHWRTRKPAHRVTLEDGTSLIASADHRFLTERGWKFVTGKERGRDCRPHLTARDGLMGPGLFAWQPRTSEGWRGKDSSGVAVVISGLILQGAEVSSQAGLRVVAVEELGKQIPMYDITTGSGDFIANGVVSHNCYARPTHEYLGFSAGLDFETKILVKEDAPTLLRQELASPRWKPRVLALSGVTDPYQPIERRLKLTRRCLEVLAEFRNPVVVITKSRLVARDADLLAELAKHDACAVFISVTTLSADLHKVLEPRTSSPERRLATIEELSKAGIPTGVLAAPVIPGLTDHELPAIIEAAARAGARQAGYVVLRLPHAVAPLFEGWLDAHFPDRKQKVLNRIRSLRGGKLNDPRFGSRMKGEGIFAQQIAALYKVACARAGIGGRSLELSIARFRNPAGRQLTFFDEEEGST